VINVLFFSSICVQNVISSALLLAYGSSLFFSGWWEVSVSPAPCELIGSSQQHNGLNILLISNLLPI
ncbi:hypothetical protein ACH5RR_028406, partial [Cinchona calisaya]